MDKYVTKTNKRKIADDSPVKDSKNEEEKVDENDAKKVKVEKQDTSKGALFPSIREALTIPFDKYKTESQFEERFKQISEFLLNQVVLMVNGKRHRFLELEYYQTCEAHNDPYTHGDTVQFTTANWYFHKSGTSYRGGTYKGLDISIGKDKTQYGGILIRCIEDDNGKVYCGPCVSVDQILKVCNQQTIVDLVDSGMKGDLSVENTKGPLYMKIDTGIPKRDVFSSPRVGLNMTKGKSKEDAQMRFLIKDYRSFCLPKKIPKGKQYMTCTLYSQGKKAGEINSLIGGTITTLENWTKAIDEGKKKDPSIFLGKKLAEIDFCQAYGAILSKVSQ